MGLRTTSHASEKTIEKPRFFRIALSTQMHAVASAWHYGLWFHLWDKMTLKVQARKAGGS
jgi:hypothetical protein